MNRLRTCPKCHHESLDSNSFRVWCLYATSCGYSIPPVTNSDVDDKQMTHNDEPTATSEVPTNEAAVWRDGIFCWRCYWYDIGDKLDSREREHSRACRGPIIRRQRHSEEHVSRLIRDVEAGERHLQSLKDDSGDIICDLEGQVERLEAERDRLLLDAAIDKRFR